MRKFRNLMSVTAAAMAVAVALPAQAGEHGWGGRDGGYRGAPGYGGYHGHGGHYHGGGGWAPWVGGAIIGAAVGTAIYRATVYPPPAPAPVVVVPPPAPAPRVNYYCGPYRNYYPYVAECPVPWEVIPY